MARKGYLTSVNQLQTSMPELMPIYERLIELAGGGDLEARFLSMYSPPAYMSACSQVAWTQDGASLIRNYDYSLKMFEGTMLYSNWLQPVIGVTDCNWGLLDGMNGSGLAASLTFGGRKVVGEGFGIPLIMRYLLETSRTVKDAINVLHRVPVHMAYNVTLIERSGLFATVFLSPDRPPVVIDEPVATNHQTEVEWSDYASLTGTIERKRVLEELVESARETETGVLRHFLNPPLYNTNFEKFFGTLYTVIYRLHKQEAEVIWPGMEIKQTFTSFDEMCLVPFTINMDKDLAR